MKRFKLFPYLLIFLFLFSCVKKEDDLISQDCVDECITIYGTLTTGNGTQPLKDVEVDVVWVKRQPPGTFGRLIRRNKAVAITDNDGFYSMTFKKREDEDDQWSHFSLNIHTNENVYYSDCDENLTDMYNLPSDTLIMRNYYYPFNAFLKVIAIGGDKTKADDNFTVEVKTKFGVNGSQECGVIRSFKYGAAIEMADLKAGALQDVEVVTTIRKDGESKINSEKIYFIGILRFCQQLFSESVVMFNW